MVILQILVKNALFLTESRFFKRFHKELDETMRRRRNLFIEKTNTRKAVRIVLVSTYGLVDNPYAGNVHNVVTMEDLFKDGMV